MGEDQKPKRTPGAVFGGVVVATAAVLGASFMLGVLFRAARWAWTGEF